MKGHVENMHTKLDEIFEWFKQNLEKGPLETAHSSLPHQPGVQVQSHNSIYFSVSIQTITGRENRKLSCLRAKFRENWLDEDDPFRSALSIFQCCCSPTSTAIDHAEALHVSCKTRTLARKLS